MPTETIREVTSPVKTESLQAIRRIKTDEIDRRVSALSFAGKTIYTMPFGLAATFITGGVPLFAPVAYYSLRTLGEGVGEIDDKQKKTDQDLKYEATRLVYRGEGLGDRGLQLKKGDNFYYVRLPDFTIKRRDPLASEQIEAMSELYGYILEEVKDGISGKDYSAIAIGLNNIAVPHSNPGIETAPKKRMVDLLEGKNAVVNLPELEAAILSSEVFEAMTLTYDEIFQKTIDALEAEIGIKISGRLLIAELRALRSKPWEERLAEAARLRKKLDIFSNSQAEALFNGLPVVELDKPNGIPVKKRLELHPSLQIVQSLKGAFLEQISYAQGDRRRLVKLDKPLEQVLAVDSKYKPLLLAYALSQILSTPESLREATRDKQVSKEDLLKKLDELGILIFEQKPLINKDKLRSRQLGRRVRDMIIAGLLSTAVMRAEIAGIRAVEQIANMQGLGLGQEQSSGTPAQSNSLQNYEKPAFPDSVPQSHLDWQIETYGNQSASGYYILSTSNRYVNGEWVVNNSLDNATLLNNSDLVDR